MEPQIKSWILNYAHWIKAHEKLLIIVLAAFLLYRGGQGIENVIARHDAAKAGQAAVVVKTDETTNKQLQDQLAQINAERDRQAKELIAQMDAATADLKKQREKDTQSTPVQIGDRWQALLSLKPGSVKSDTATTTVTNDVALQTVEALEEIPVLRIQVADLTTELDNDQKVITQQDNTIAGLNKQIVDEKASHVADVNLEKAKARHSFWKGLKIGLIIGAVGTEAVRVWAGHP